MNKLLKFALVLVFLMCMPVLGWFSWEMVQDGNWLMAYLSSGLSWGGPFLGWRVMGE